MIQNHLIGGKKPRNLQTAHMNLFDIKGLAGIQLPHPPTAPARVPKDVDWWRRNLGAQNMKTKITAKEYLHPAVKQLFDLMNGV